MQTRRLGSSGIEVSAIGLGCMGMTESYGAADEAEAVATIHRALDLGVNFLDTAAVYGRGANEALVGRAIRGRRAEVVLATKCGFTWQDGSRATEVDGSPAHIRSFCERSLQLLQTEVIDVFYLHRVDPRTPIEESMRAMADLVRAGKIRAVGLSEASPSTLRRASAIHPVAALQSEYSLWFREPETSVLPACRELGIALVPFSPLGRGYLAGSARGVDTLAPDDMRRGFPRFQPEQAARNAAMMEPLDDLARRTGVTSAQVALAWLLARGPDIVPIPGTKRRTYLEQNVAAVDVQLASSDLASLNARFPVRSAFGPRYGEAMERLVDKS